MASVTLEKVNKVFGRDHIIKDVDLSIGDGEFVVFVGPSGCGKSTLLRLIAGLESITDGDLNIGGTVVNDLPPRERGVGMVFQSYALYPHMTVYDNMAFDQMLFWNMVHELGAMQEDLAVERHEELMGELGWMNQKWLTGFA